MLLGQINPLYYAWCVYMFIIYIYICGWMEALFGRSSVKPYNNAKRGKNIYGPCAHLYEYIFMGYGCMSVWVCVCVRELTAA